KLDGTTYVLHDNGNGTFTYTAAGKLPISFSANTTTVTESAGVYTFTDGAGTIITTIDTNVSADVVSLDNSKNGLVASNVQEAIDEVATLIKSGAGVTLVDNNNGTVSLNAADGAVLGTVDKTEVTDNSDGTFTLDSGNGIPVTIDTNADELAFDNSTNGFTSTNVQGALEEIQENLVNTTDVLKDNGDGTYTHTAVDGTPITIDANTTDVSVVDGVSTFTDGTGTIITTLDTNVSADVVSLDNTNNNLAASHVQEAIDHITTLIKSG